MCDESVDVAILDACVMAKLLHDSRPQSLPSTNREYGGCSHFFGCESKEKLFRTPRIPAERDDSNNQDTDNANGDDFNRNFGR